MEIPSLYKKYHVDKGHTSIGLFRELKKNYKIKKAFYPGSHVHITPSLIFSNVTYADSFKNTDRFFKDEVSIKFIKHNKEYPEEPIIKFYQQDYNNRFIELNNDFDLVISQYAGFVGQVVKSYLKVGGLLVCNNSHGDASMAALDSDYKLVAVYRRYSDKKFGISGKKLDEYLIPKSGKHPTKDFLLKSMKGIAYTKNPTGYIFKKTK